MSEDNALDIFLRIRDSVPGRKEAPEQQGRMMTREELHDTLRTHKRGPLPRKLRES